MPSTAKAAPTAKVVGWATTLTTPLVADGHQGDPHQRECGHHDEAGRPAAGEDPGGGVVVEAREKPGAEADESEDCRDDEDRANGERRIHRGGCSDARTVRRMNYARSLTV